MTVRTPSPAGQFARLPPQPPIDYATVPEGMRRLVRWLRSQQFRIAADVRPAYGFVRLSVDKLGSFIFQADRLVRCLQLAGVTLRVGDVFPQVRGTYHPSETRAYLDIIGMDDSMLSAGLGEP